MIIYFREARLCCLVILSIFRLISVQTTRGVDFPNYMTPRWKACGNLIKTTRKTF